VNERLDPYATPDVQRADALRRVELVARERQEVGAERRDVDLDLAGGLRGLKARRLENGLPEWRVAGLPVERDR
jgi:hypothetical protein